tara:strand:- start:557 stop:820 length:264 start_codon:yes stop_codon:yes gene_type:complete
MQYLFSGQVSIKRLALLISLTKINSDDIIEALADHFVKGLSESAAASVNGVQQPNLKRAIKKLNDVAEAVEKIKELDWLKFKQQSLN